MTTPLLYCRCDLQRNDNALLDSVWGQQDVQ